jgi:hypothetical protein
VRLLEHEQPGLQVLGDSAYGTGDARAASPRPAAAICEALDGRNPARSQNH